MPGEQIHPETAGINPAAHVSSPTLNCDDEAFA
jgi:hypothetical protein